MKHTQDKCSQDRVTDQQAQINRLFYDNQHHTKYTHNNN